MSTTMLLGILLVISVGFTSQLPIPLTDPPQNESDVHELTDTEVVQRSLSNHSAEMVEDEEAVEKRSLDSNETSEELGSHTMDHGIHRRSPDHHHPTPRPDSLPSNIHRQRRSHGDDHENDEHNTNHPVRRAPHPDENGVPDHHIGKRSAHPGPDPDPRQKDSGGHGHRIKARSVDAAAEGGEPETGAPETEAEVEHDEQNDEEQTTRLTNDSKEKEPHSFASDFERPADSVAIRVKRVSRAGSSHRGRQMTKGRGNSKAGQGDDAPNAPGNVD